MNQLKQKDTKNLKEKEMEKYHYILTRRKGNSKVSELRAGKINFKVLKKKDCKDDFKNLFYILWILFIMK